MGINLKWTERKFDFGFRKEYLPFFIERLHGTAPRIEELIQNIPENKLAEKKNNEWSVKEHIGHLIDLEELHEARIDELEEGLKVLRAADMTNKKTYEANHNETSSAELVTRLRKVRGQFITRLKNFPQEKLDHKALHPRLQKEITLTDLAYFVTEHDNHHLTLLSSLLTKGNE